MKKAFLMVTCVLGLAAMVSSCGDKKPNLMTEEEMAMKVDSLYQAEVETLGPDLDQACQLKLESLVATKVDSILTANNVVQ